MRSDNHAAMLFKFQWQIEKYCSELETGFGLVLMSPPSKIKDLHIEDSKLK